MQEKDSTATHFIANRRSKTNGWAITLYRFVSRDGKLCKEDHSDCRPQYLGPIGWSFHSFRKDKDAISKLKPIEKLEEITGDNLEKEIWQEGNIYAG